MEELLRPWEQLTELVHGGTPKEVARFVQDLPPGEISRVLSRLGENERATVLLDLDASQVADLVEEIPGVQAAEMIEQLEPEKAAEILRELASDEQADLLAEIDRQDADAILAEMEPGEADEARHLAGYSQDVAGGLMATEFLRYREAETCGEIIEDLRRRAIEYTDYQIQYVYVNSTTDELVGVLPLRELLFTSDDTPATSIMIRNPLSVREDTSLEELGEFFDRHAFLGVPVVDGRNHVRGVVHRSAVARELGARAGADHLKSQGIIGGEEFRSMPLRYRALKRLSWLSVNVVLNILAASVIAYYQDTLSSVIALAVFLPIISDMSGCSGNQAVAVSMRELALGLIKPYEVFYVWAREIGVGATNGVVLGCLIAGVAWLWKGNPYLGLVVGSALAANTMVAVSIGGTVPMILKRFHLDPALASGPILTTITDMCGFFFVLSLGSAMLPRLVSA